MTPEEFEELVAESERSKAKLQADRDKVTVGDFFLAVIQTLLAAGGRR